MNHNVILAMLIEVLNRCASWLAVIALLYPELGKLIRKLRAGRTREQYAADLDVKSAKTIERWDAGEVPGALYATRIMQDARRYSFLLSEKVEEDFRGVKVYEVKSVYERFREMYFAITTKEH